MGLIEQFSGRMGGGGGVPSIAIAVDTSNLPLAANTVEKWANGLQKELNKINDSTGDVAKQASKTFDGLNLGKLVEAQAIWAAINTGIKFAADLVSDLASATSDWHDQLVVAKAQFAGMTGQGAAGAEAMMGRVRELADVMNISLNEALTTTRLLLPVLAKTGRGIDDLIGLAQTARQLSFAAPQEGALTGSRGSAFALAELAAGQWQSLVRRFNIGAENITPIMEELGVSGEEALKIYLDRLGYTVEATLESTQTMSNGFERLMSAVVDLADRGLGPLLDNFVIPGIMAMADFAAGAGKIVDRVKELFGQAGGFGDVFSNVRQLAEAIVNLPGMAFAPMMTLLLDNMGYLEAETATLTEVFKGSINFYLDNLIPALTLMAAQALNDAAALANFGAWIQATGAHVLRFAAMLARVQGHFRTAAELERSAETAQASADVWRETADTLESSAVAVIAGGASLQQALNEWRTGSLPDAVDDISIPDTSVQEDELADLLDEWDEFNRQRQAIEEDTDRKILGLKDDFEREQIEAAEELNRKIARSNEDFTIKRGRESDELNRDIADEQADANRDIEQLRQQEHEDRREMEIEFSREEQDRQRDHLLKMQRMQEDHNDTIADAAARLDAVSIINENRRYNKQRRRAEEDFQLEQAQSREEFAIEMEQRRSDVAERIELIKEESQRRIDELRRHYQIEDRLAREDQARKISRMRQDHQLEMAERQAQAERRIAALKAQGQRELTELQNEFIRKTNAQLQHEKIQYESQDRSLQAFRDYWDSIRQIQGGGLRSGSSGTTIGGAFGSRQTGGRAVFTGAHNLERDEMVLSRGAVRAWESIMGQRMTQAGVLASAKQQGGKVDLSVNVDARGYAGDPNLLVRKIRREVDTLLLMRLQGFAN